jgi:hypothetical protein
MSAMSSRKWPKVLAGFCEILIGFAPVPIVCIVVSLGRVFDPRGAPGPPILLVGGVSRIYQGVPGSARDPGTSGSKMMPEGCSQADAKCVHSHFGSSIPQCPPPGCPHGHLSL